MKAQPVRGPDRPFDVSSTRNKTDDQFTVRVGYAIRRVATGPDGELAYFDDPHPKVIDLELHAWSDTNAIALACDGLEDAIPNDVNERDVVEIIDIKIVERPALRTGKEPQHENASPSLERTRDSDHWINHK